MAIRIIDEYASQVDPVNAATWPDGEPRNVSAPAANDGTPFEVKAYKDLEGFKQHLLKVAAIVPSGTPENALASQMYEALQTMFLEVVDRRSNGGDILEVGDRLAPMGRYGLREVFVSTTQRQSLPGGGRNFADTKDLVLPAAMSKFQNAEWVAGDGNGGTTAEGITLYGSSGDRSHLRRFLVAKPDGTTDIVYSPDVDAADFFAGLGAAAGYSDDTLYRRLSWAVVNTSGVSQEWRTYPNVPGRVYIENPGGLGITSGSTGSRNDVEVGQVPPDVFGRFRFAALGINDPGLIQHLFTPHDSVDYVPSTARFTCLSGTSDGGDSTHVSIEFDIWVAGIPYPTIYYRNTSSATDNNLCAAGWYDSGVDE